MCDGDDGWTSVVYAFKMIDPLSNDIKIVNILVKTYPAVSDILGALPQTQA